MLTDYVKDYLKLRSLLNVPTDRSLTPFKIQFLFPTPPLECAVSEDEIVSERLEKLQDASIVDVVEQMTDEERAALRRRVLGR